MNGASAQPGHIRPRLTEPRIRLNAVSGVSSSLLTRAIRRVEARADGADAPRILAATALAADRADASFIETLTPRPSLRLSLHLIDLLQDEVLTLWHSGDDSTAHVLQAIDRLRFVRAAIERRFQQLPGAPLV